MPTFYKQHLSLKALTSDYETGATRSNAGYFYHVIYVSNACVSSASRCPSGSIERNFFSVTPVRSPLERGERNTEGSTALKTWLGGWASSLKAKGHRFDSRSGLPPGLCVWSSVWTCVRGNRWMILSHRMFLCLSFSLLSPLSRSK